MTHPSQAATVDQQPRLVALRVSQFLDQAGGNLTPAGEGLVDATDFVYRTMFSATIWLSITLTAWGLTILPLDSNDHHKVASVGIGVAVVIVGALAVRNQESLFVRTRGEPRWLFVLAAFCLAIVAADGPWRSVFTMAVFAPMLVAGVFLSFRQSLAFATVMCAAYLGVMFATGHTWSFLVRHGDNVGMLTNLANFFLIGVFSWAFVNWVARYIARINQVIGAGMPGGAGVDGSVGNSGSPAPSMRTKPLSVREVETVQLVADGRSNQEIADKLFVSVRTVQTHVAAALKKTESANRTDLAILAIREGLVPLEPITRE